MNGKLTVVVVVVRSVEAVQEHIDPSSYSWCLIRFAIIQLVLHNLNTFLPQVGIELQGR